jgi:hypothetical protein
MTPPASVRASTVRYLWFWTFWHWSRESYRSGTVLRDPLHGVGSHWDEWFHHEATQHERRAVEAAGDTVNAQRQFITWLVRYWSREVECGGNRPPVRFVLGQLAMLPPFDGWRAFHKYRTSYGAAGISAIVLSEDSRGEPADVRRIEAIALPADADAGAPTIVPEGFHADSGDLQMARRAASSVLGGAGLLSFLAWWVATGRRSYPRWLGAMLTAAWLLVAALIIYLLAGPDPGERVVPLVASVMVLWLVLVAIAIATAAWVMIRAWRQARQWNERMKHAQLRLRMNTGLTLKGASAGLPFSLNVLLSLYRSRPRSAGAWLWHRVFRATSADPSTWAATGVVTLDGDVEPVVLEQKLRASLHHPSLRNVLAPRQRDANRIVADSIADPQSPVDPAAAAARPAGAAVGLARGSRRLRVHQCRNVGQALMAIGNVTSRWQVATNVLALATTVVLLSALPGVRSILRPPPPPILGAQPSMSPYALWLGLDSKAPELFNVVLESPFWANRRAPMRRYTGANGSIRAEILLRRLSRPIAGGEEDGIFWVERRRRFLTREFAPGERVGRYTLSYLTRPQHD